MIENESYEILVIEARDGLRKRICDALISQGYRVTFSESSTSAISTIEAEHSPPFALVISCFRMPDMSGEDILKKAREHYPDSPRILIADASDLYSIVSAINTAGIHSCLSVPFDDEDLINHVMKGLDQFTAIKKFKNLKSVSERQNKQMFLIANNLKKKAQNNVDHIKEKERQIRLLKDRINAVAGTAAPDEGSLTLKDILQNMGTPLSPEDLGNEFLNLKTLLKNFIEKTVQDTAIRLTPISYNELVEPPPADETRITETTTILSAFYAIVNKSYSPDKTTPVQNRKSSIEDYLELSLSKDKTKAYIRIKYFDTEILNPASIKKFVYQNDIIIGIKNDHLIELWLSNASTDGPPFIIAEGKEPVQPKDSEIKYHFPTDFLQAGKMNPDGSIDFRDRGETPFVDKDTFLAAKIFPLYGKQGMNVFGETIPVEEPADLAFSAGPGTSLSDDGTKIYSETNGQPYLDPLGNVSVFPELRIDGDVGFKTGNIQFDGNIYVKGSVQQGFCVKGATLTVEQIEGADSIELTGDLIVSSGITNAPEIKVMGNIQAKYINSSEIDSFGDIIVQREIIDSKIRLSGACIIENGKIISSEIKAKMGVSAGEIGTDVSRPSILTVGVDEYVNMLVAEIDTKLKKNKAVNDNLKSEISDLDKEYNDLHGIISGYAFAQDQCQKELNDVEKKLSDLQASGNMLAYQKVKQSVKQIQEKANQAEYGINKGFERQDKISNEISQINKTIISIEDSNQALVYEKKSLKEFSDRDVPLPEVRIAKRVMPGTQVIAANSSMIVKESVSKCRIMEVQKRGNQSGGLFSYEMKIVSY